MQEAKEGTLPGMCVSVASSMSWRGERVSPMAEMKPGILGLKLGPQVWVPRPRAATGHEA